MDQFKGRFGNFLQEFTWRDDSEDGFFINVAEKDMRISDWKLKVGKFRPGLRFYSQGYQTIGTLEVVSPHVKYLERNQEHDSKMC